MFVCICNALNEKDIKKACKSLCSIDGEAALKSAGCNAECGQCLDYIESFILSENTTGSSSTHTL